MSQFVQALRSYRTGKASREDLLSEVDRQLGEQRAAADTLLSQLAREQQAAALPTDIRREIELKISSWGRDRTLLRSTTVAGGPRAAEREDNSPTVLLNRPGAAAETAANRMAARVGTVLLARFKLVELVGVGGMSRVYKAIDLRRAEAHARDPYIAVKVLTVAFRDHSGSLAVLQREAHKLQSLTHANIVRVIDCDRDGQTVFMTMEFLSGASLQYRLLNGISREQAIDIVTSIASALEFAHRTHIVHGDLKPGNVIITDAGETKVIDFGIARFVARPKEGQKETPGAEHRDEWETLDALTPPYASPEMLEGQEPDPRDDVYALACIAYELLTGKHPFDRVAATQARDSGLKPPRAANTSGRQYRALLGGLQFDRARRTPTAQQFIDEFAGKRSFSIRQAAVAAAVALVAAVGLYFAYQTTDPTRATESSPSLQPGVVFRDCPTCPLMRVLPAGRFVQGAAAGAAFEQPQHEVNIAHPFAAAQREVTVGEFQEFVEATGHDASGCAVYDGEWQVRAAARWSNVDARQTAMHAVSCVSWSDAVTYAEWLSKKTGHSYRLPSASEWEYAARAGSSAAQPWQTDAEACGSGNVADQHAAQLYPGWTVYACDDGYAQVAPVGAFAENAFGLQDTLGNVFEWVQDCWHDDYVDSPTTGAARLDRNCVEREMRGGSWFTPPEYISVSYRNRFAADYRSSSVGFRVVREIPE